MDRPSDAGVYFGSTDKLPNNVAVGVIVLFCVFISSFAWYAPRGPAQALP